MWNSSPTLLPEGSAVFTEAGVLVGPGATVFEKVCGTRLQLTALQKTSKIHSKIPGSTVFSQHRWGEEKYDAFCYFQVLALSSHPLLNNKGQIWTPDSYKVYLLRRGKKNQTKNLFLFLVRWTIIQNVTSTFFSFSIFESVCLKHYLKPPPYI